MTHQDEIKFIQFLSEEVGQPFEWGFRDCNTLALRWLDLLTGEDYSSPVLRKYKTERGAIGFHKRYGKTLTDVLIQAGAVEIPRNFQQRGDFLVVADKQWQMGHICMGDLVLSAGPGHGCCTWPMERLEPGHKIWRVRACPRL